MTEPRLPLEQRRQTGTRGRSNSVLYPLRLANPHFDPPWPWGHATSYRHSFVKRAPELDRAGSGAEVCALATHGGTAFELRSEQTRHAVVGSLLRAIAVVPDARNRSLPGSVPRPGMCARRAGHLSDILVARDPLHTASETRRTTVSIRALFGTRDAAVHRSLAAPETANADDYPLETVDTTHFIIDERPDLVRTKLIEVAEETRR